MSRRHCVPLTSVPVEEDNKADDVGGKQQHGKDDQHDLERRQVYLIYIQRTVRELILTFGFKVRQNV